MKSARALIAAAIGCLMAFWVGLAAAAVTQPSGLVVPRTTNNGEVQLSDLFAQRGEALDWKADADTAPEVFSPLCGFTAEFVLHQSSAVLGVGWYNADPAAAAPPAPADIHLVVPAGSPVGTKILGASIRSDPAYRGGLVGFALLGNQIHYTERRWNVLCSGCSPPAPWILSLSYGSKKVPNAYYVAFEDGPVGPLPGNFGNDGDYNDFVFFFTGLACQGAEAPCDTGLRGVCAAGLTECTSGGALRCRQVSPPGAEQCDGLDNDCNGKVDDGALCAAGRVCDRGLCVIRCDPEFPCQGGLLCQGGSCVEPACAGKQCAEGQVCRAGLCAGPCDGVLCPQPQQCRVGRCVEPCSGITCGEGQVCRSGVCVTGCACAACRVGLQCEGQSGQCVEPGCVNMSCGPGTSCRAGACVPSCEGAVCPQGQTCRAGACVDLPPPDMALPPPPDLSDRDPFADLAAGGGGVAVPDGCGCRVAAGAPAPLPRVGLLLLGLLGLLRRRRYCTGGGVKRSRNQRVIVGK